MPQYVTKYTSELDIERLVQFEISSTTSPSSQQVLEIIESVERYIDAKKLGWEDGVSPGDGYTMTDLYIDIPVSKDEEKDSFETLKGSYATKVYLTGYPIIKMISLHKRVSDIKETPIWEPLVQGYYPGWTPGSSDYMLLTATGKDGQRYGIGLLFYSDKQPLEGRARLKASFTYSYNVPTRILKEYATLKAGIEVLRAAVLSGEPTRIASWTGGDFQTFVNTQVREQIAEWEARIRKIEEDHFPTVEAGPISL